MNMILGFAASPAEAAGIEKAAETAESKTTATALIVFALVISFLLLVAETG
jgi:hypothetical protein